MTKLVRVTERLYVADGAAVDVGGGREKVLCFITSAPCHTPDLDLEKAFASNGSVAIVSAPSGSAWKKNRFFIDDISAISGCGLALVRFDSYLTPSIDARMVVSVAGSKWLTSGSCQLRAEFGEVGVTIPKGVRLSLLPGATALQIDAPAGLNIDLDKCFSLYGVRLPATKQLVLGLASSDPGRLEFQFSITVSSYNEDEPMLGLLYFRAVQHPLNKSFNFKRFHYPLFSLPPGNGSISVHLSASLDLMEPSPGEVPCVMFRSSVRLESVVLNGADQKKLPLNQFSPDGTRLFATALSVRKDLRFHFVKVPTLMSTMTSKPTYKEVALLPQGTIELTSPSVSLLGSGLLERVSTFDRLKFDLHDPADALDAQLWSPKGIILGKTIDTEPHPDAYLSKLAITSATRYEASSLNPLIKFSPDRLALYSLDSGAGTYRPIECGVPQGLPISPIDFGEPTSTNQTRCQFDSNVIARHRIGLLSKAAMTRASSRQVFAGEVGAESSSTPQGFKVMDEGSFWSDIEFARGTGWRIALSFGSDPAVAKELQSAFMEKEIFIVARRLPAVPAGTLQPPRFVLEFMASGWVFRTSITDSATSYAASADDIDPLIVIKFGSRSVKDLVDDSDRWTAAKTFVGSASDISAVKSRLKAVIKQLQDDHTNEGADGDTFPGPFVNTDSKSRTGKLFDPNWNGVVALSLAMPSTQSPFPVDLQPILDEYASRIRASIICADIRPVGVASDESSQVLALVRYLNPAQPKIDNGTDPDCAGGFDLKMLKVRLLAARVEKFECRLSFSLEKFFAQNFGVGGVLVGAYDRRLESGIPIDVYSFAFESPLSQTWGPGSFLTTATLTRLGYERAQSSSGEARGRFLITGNLAFNLDHVGIKDLEFDRLGIEFSSKSRSFEFRPGLLKVNVERRNLSKLLEKLPFRLTSFVFGRLAPGKFLSLDVLGFQPLPLFGGGSTGKGLFSYGFTFDLDLGSLGALSKNLEGFKGELLLGWQMDSGKFDLSLGFKLKGNKGGPLDFSLLDVIQVRAKQFGFGQLRNGDAYYVFAAGLQLRLLNQTFPEKGADQSVFVFYPSTGGTVAWLYARVDDSKDSVIPLFAIGQRIEIQNLLGSKTTLEGITRIKDVFKHTIEPGNLPYDGTSDVLYNPKADWLLGLEAKIFDVATLQLLVAEPDLYGARVTISKEKFPFLTKDWFFDLLYRRLDEDTGIFSMEVPPPIDMLDFGAVQVILPTIRGEVGTSGSHLLVDLGYPGKKSIAAWQRTGKIVAGIFGGDGGAYLGRVASRTFPVQLTTKYAKVYEFKKDSCFMVGMAGSFGLMRYFSQGPMSGHASLTGFFMIEGAMATIQTKRDVVADPALTKPPSTYLKLDGQFGVKGCIEACVDFKLVKAYVGLEFKVYFGFNYETWKGIMFRAGMVLNAYARLVIGRIRIPFDGSFEIALEFRFSFETTFELRLSNDDSRWIEVFEDNPLVSPKTLVIPNFRPTPPQVRPQGKTQAEWIWPSPILETLGYTVKKPVEFWFVAVPTLADETSSSGKQVPGVIGHLLAGEHPVYLNRPNSILVLADALLRWMLPQIKGLKKWDGSAKFEPHDPAFLHFHQALQPDNKDSRLESVDVAPSLTGIDSNQLKPGVRLVSREANIAKARPGFEKLTAARLFELYDQCFDTLVALPKDGNDKEKQTPACVPFPLPPLFELSYVVQSHDGADWKTESQIKRDLTQTCMLSENEVDALQRQLDQFHALLKAEREVSTKKAISQSPMQEWIFLSWHQLFCTELLRLSMNMLEGPNDITFEELRAKMVTDAKGPAYIAAQGVSRLFAGGLRFTHFKKTQGSFALAGTMFNAPELALGQRALLCLKQIPGVSGWSLNNTHVAACGKDGLPDATLGFEVSGLAQESEFVIPSFTPTRPKGYEDLPREYPLSKTATMGSDPVYAFPRELALISLSSQGLVIDWKARKRNNAGNELEDLNPQPASAHPHTAFRLRGMVVTADQFSFELGMLPLALEDRELLQELAAAPQTSLRLGYRTASSGPDVPYTELTAGNLQQLSAFRVDVSQEERPTLSLSTAPLPYYAESSGELIALLSAWTKTGSRTCRMTVPSPPGSTAVAAGVEVEVLLLSDADTGTGKCGKLGNVVTGTLPEGASWFARTTEILRRVPSSPPEALMIEVRRDAMSQALVRVPEGLRALLNGDDWMPVGQLRELKRHRVFGTSTESAAFKADFDAFVLQAEAQASHFDLLALQVKVDGIEMIGFEKSLPLIPTTPKIAQFQVYLDQPHVYQGFVPAKLLGIKTSPYELVGKRVEVLGRLRDHYGQQAPHEPVHILDRIEEYCDEIVGPNAWEHITAFLRSSPKGISLVLRANVDACNQEGGRADFVRRRLGLIRHQLGDSRLEVSAEWSFGDKTSTTIDKQVFVSKLIDSLETSLTVRPAKPFVELVTPLPLPKLAKDWEIQPFAAVLRISRPSGTDELVRETTAALDPEGLAVKGSDDSVNSLKKFFEPVLTFFNASLAVCDPGVAHGSFFLVNSKCISGEILKDDDGFYSILPFANKPVSMNKPDATIVDRDLDATLSAACESLDSLLDDKQLGSVRSAVHSLLSLKRQMGLTSGNRLKGVFNGNPSPDAARRAVEDAVSQRASACWRLASIADLAVKPRQAATSSIFLKVVGDFQLEGPPGSPKQALPVSTTGITCAAEWRIPVVAWMGAEPGMVSVPALKFAARHILVDLAEVKSLAKATGALWLRLVDVGPARAEFVLPTFTAPAPLRRVLDTPIASGHIGTTKTLKPQTLATAKIWDYSATYSMPGHGLQPGTDAVYARVTSPIAGQSLTRTRFSEQSLLVAADNFIATAGECIGGMAVISDLQASAARLEHELANYAPISSFGLGKVEIVSARIAHNGKKWESSNADLEVDVDKDGASLKLGVKSLDACRYPCATTDLYATRNEQLAGGFGARPQKRPVFQEFIYATPSVGFKSEALPIIEVAEMLTGGTASNDPQKWLTQVINELLGGATTEQLQQLLVQCTLGFYPNNVYSLTGQNSEPAAVTMLTSRGDSASTDIPAGASSAATMWLSEVGGSAALGFWSAEVIVFRNGAGSAPERFLALHRVRGELAKNGNASEKKKLANGKQTGAKAKP